MQKPRLPLCRPTKKESVFLYSGKKAVISAKKLHAFSEKTALFSDKFPGIIEDREWTAPVVGTGVVFCATKRKVVVYMAYSPMLRCV